MRERNARRRGAALGGGDARHDLIVNAGPLKRGGLLATTAEDERIAALQADDVRPVRASRTSMSLISACGMQ